MVIGNGMIAKRFNSYKDNKDVLIFASGVSNSKNRNQAQYDRESDLLEKTIEANPSKVLVYFSTCSIKDPGEANSPYVEHKKQLEDLIQKKLERYYIFRVSNIAGTA